MRVETVSDDKAAAITKELSEKSYLKDGPTIVSLFELNEILMLLPENTPDQQYVKDVSFKAYARIAGRVYGFIPGLSDGKEFAQHFIGDMELAKRLVFEKALQ